MRKQSVLVVRRYPNLFLVGAPKCGTTSLAHYLGQHPDIFVPSWKEPSFFGADLTKCYSRQTEADYLSLYQDWTNERYGLDASTSYFYSRMAPKEMLNHVPNVRILIMVRNPIEAIYSMYFENRYEGIETILTFEDALLAEKARLAQGSPAKRGLQEQLLYSRIYAYTDNIARYHAVIGRERVHILVLDDFKRDARAEFVKVIKLLDLDQACADTIDFSVKNAAKQPFSRRVSRFAVSPGWVGRVAEPFFSKAQRLWIRKMIKCVNTRAVSNPPMKPETRRLLAERFAPEVERLSELLDRDLSHWLQASA